MAFCTNCGKELVEEAKFCANCGVAVTEDVSNKQRKVVYDGEIHKCPNCGEVMDSFVSRCPSCGYELRGTQATNSVRELIYKLDCVNRERYNQPVRKRLEKVFVDDDEKINLIMNFPVPNTKEDILEFAILAANNIDYKQYGIGNSGVFSKNQRAVSDAWISKLNQTYEKAKILLGASSDFVTVQQIYERTQKKIRFQRIMLVLLCAPPLLLPLLIILLVVAL